MSAVCASLSLIDLNQVAEDKKYKSDMRYSSKSLSFPEDYLFLFCTSIYALHCLNIADRLLLQMQVSNFVSTSPWIPVTTSELSKHQHKTTFMSTAFVNDGCQFGISLCVFLSLIDWQWCEDTQCFWEDPTGHGWDKNLYTSRESFKSTGRSILEPGNEHTVWAIHVFPYLWWK